LASPSGRGLTLDSFEELTLKAGSDGEKRRQAIKQLAEGPREQTSPLLEKVARSTREAYAASDRLRQIAAKREGGVTYPATGLASRLKKIAHLIVAEVPQRVYFTSLGGFDTHSDQARTHGELLGELSGAIAAFHEDLSKAGHGQRVLTVTFSEFGRRVSENGSHGTDHGAGSQMFVVGEGVIPGPIGAHPDLTDLIDGDLRFHFDFRRVYATLLDGWLKVSSQDVLEAAFEHVLFLVRRPVG
jgi:uncharacterized protein (DUF1501 family)